ncbi:MAG TPA: sigma-70 family RNA polymerase sigma factor [Gemmataceae bacterium]|nr:sigma-70 family RNA polymerase sigma factor [Gemmataceae bacterium]
MPARHLPTLLHQLRLAAGRPPASDVSDAELLTCFAEQRDESAFAALVQRHGPMIQELCRRWFGGQADAEDVWQATFLILARRARSIRQRGSIAGWLHSVAYRVACKARRATARRRRYERQAPVRAGTEHDRDVALRQLCQALDEELQQLSETYRAPLVLCHLQARTRDETARLLGVSLRTVDRRLEHGRKLLRARLERRGLTLSAVLLAADLSRQTVSAASMLQLGHAVIQASGSLVSASGTSAGVSARALLWSKEILSAGVTGHRLLLAALLMASVAVGAGLAISPALAPPRPPDEQAASQAARRRVPQPQPPPTRRPHVDRFGDPLPAEAVARMGSGRMRHVGWCDQLVYSPDGKLLASCGGQWLMLWDPASGKLQRRFPIKSDRPTACTFCTDGIRVAATTSDKRTVLVQTFDPATGQIRQALRMPDLADTADMSLSPDGRLLACAVGKDIRLYDAVTGRLQLRIPGKGIFTRSVDFAPDGHAIAVADFSDTVHLYDTNTGKSIAELKHAGDRFNCATWSPDGRFVATVPLDNDKRPPLAGIWDVATGKEIQRFPAPGGFKHDIAFSPDGRYVLVGSILSHGRRAAILWELSTGKKIRIFPTYSWGTVFSPDSKTVAICDGPIALFDVATGTRKPGSADPYLNWIRDLHFSAGGTRLYAAAAGPIAWDVHSGRELAGLFHPSATEWVRKALSPDASLVAEMDADGTLRLRAARTGTEVHRLGGPGSYVLGLRFSPDGRRLYTTAFQGPVSEWDVATGKLQRTLPTPGSGVFDPAISPDGRWLAGGLLNAHGAGKRVIVWDLATGKQRAQLYMGAGPSYWLAWSRDSHLLAAVAAGTKQPGEARVWDITRGTLGRVMTGKIGSSVAFSPDGRMLATGDYQGHLTLWELTSGRVRHRFLGHEDSIDSIAFSPDGRLLASASTDAPVFLWAVRDKSARSSTLAQAALAHTWKALAGDDAAAAWDAVKALAAVPAQSVPFLQKQLHPAAKADDKQLKQQIAELDSRRFAVRQQATAALAQSLEQAAPLLRKALTSQLSTEARRRIEQLLQGLDPPTGERLRQLRAVEVLEYAATPEARSLLAGLAQGVPEAGVTRAAKAALQRLVTLPLTRPPKAGASPPWEN